MKRNLLISGLIATAVAAFGAVGITSGELDLPGLNQRIDNIDARTTNNESDIQKLQESTQTAPGEHVDVPAPVTVKVVQPPAEPTPAPAFVEPTPAPTAEPTPVPTPCPPQATPVPAPGTSIYVITPGECR
ncbi:UNVERIFIED_ORG: hypothetical protein ABID57_000682 [Arthrobacter sp. UYEF1]